MKTILKTFKILPLLLVLVAFQSCNNDDDDNIPQTKNIVGTAVDTPQLSSLVAALKAADGDLVSVLNGNGPFTVLAPTNQAFQTFLTENGFASLSDVPTDVLSNLLLNHVIAGNVKAADLVAKGSGTVPTSATGADGKPLTITFDATNGVKFNGYSTVTTADIAASNGTIHIVDAVIALPVDSKTIVETAIATPQLSSLVAALQAADGNLVSVLNGDGPFTVFAPTNEAFAKFLADNKFASLSAVPTDVLSQILLNHVISGNVTATDLVAAGSGYANTNASGPGGKKLSLYFNAQDGVKINGISKVTSADIAASNGTVHVVDAVIALPTVVDFAVANPALSSLVAALQSADSQNPSPKLIPTLSGKGPFTVFAPTNAAFSSLLTELKVGSLADLAPATVEAVLKYHVVAGANVTSGDLATGTVKTLGGDVALDASKLTLTDPNGRVSNIIKTLVDIQAVNGVVHAIDNVLLPKQ